MGAAQYALNTKKGVNKVSILDWDVHFGNGISALVTNDDRIRYASTHQMDIFPGGLSGEENWRGPKGNLLNVGIEASSGKEAYLKSLEATILPFLLEDEAHTPDLFIICAGYDALASDPMAMSASSQRIFTISLLSSEML